MTTTCISLVKKIKDFSGSIISLIHVPPPVIQIVTYPTQLLSMSCCKSSVEGPPQHASAFPLSHLTLSDYQ